MDKSKTRAARFANTEKPISRQPKECKLMQQDCATEVTIFERLETRYRNFKDTAKLPKRLSRRASAPLLIYPHAKWEPSKIKLLIVGQETLRWQYDPAEVGVPGQAIKNFNDFSSAADGVRSMWRLYDWHRLGRQYPKLNSPFWRGFRALDAAINPEGDSALWTNLFKVNVSGSVLRNCTRAEVAKILKAQQGLLQDEVSVLKPDVIVFFTGPRYDSALRSEFPDVEFRPFDGAGKFVYPLSSLALLSGSGLPVKVIRSYHPEYLQRSRQLSLISKIAKWASC
jgi:hypothetical protein